MNRQAFLIHPSVNGGGTLRKKIFSHYRMIQLKRFARLTILAFFFEYLSIIHLPDLTTYVALYPAIGVSFVICYFLGNQAILGLLLGGGLAYFFHGVPPGCIITLLMADVGAGCLGAFLCSDVFASDIPYLAKSREWLTFFLINGLIVCMFSACFRMLALWGLSAQNKYHFFLYWLADLNSIICLFAFISAWMAIYLSRERIVRRDIKPFHIVLCAFFIIATIFLMKKSVALYFIVLSMGFGMYVSFLYGYILSTALVYMQSMVYTAYFSLHSLGSQNFLISICLFLFIVLTLLIGNSQKRFS